MARPRIEIDKVQFEKLCAIQCPLVEIAGWFGCSEDTIENWCKREYGMRFTDVFQQKRGVGKISLRRKQFQVAESGNTSMLIWLGKQYLGQKEQQEISISESTDETVRAMDEYFKRESPSSDKAESD